MTIGEVIRTRRCELELSQKQLAEMLNTTNKSISKCRDSYRISKEDKDYLLNFKKPTKK